MRCSLGKKDEKQNHQKVKQKIYITKESKKDTNKETNNENTKKYTRLPKTFKKTIQKNVRKNKTNSNIKNAIAVQNNSGNNPPLLPPKIRGAIKYLKDKGMTDYKTIKTGYDLFRNKKKWHKRMNAMTDLSQSTSTKRR